MILTRRSVLELGGRIAAGLVVRPTTGRAGTAVEIVMQGNADGSRVAFDPVGLHVPPGRTIRWINDDAGNAHTATAYHPDIMDRPRRIPRRAKPWDSRYLLPGESFSVKLTAPGVYDFYCIPHEHAGMVGRIVVGNPPQGWQGYPVQPREGMALPDVALEGFPPVEEIVQLGAVRKG